MRMEEHHCSNAFRSAALWAYVPRCSWFLRCSSSLCILLRPRVKFRRGVPFLRRPAPGLSSLIRVLLGVHPWCHDLLHQGELAVLRVRRISAVYETPYLCSVGFFHGTDKSFHAALRDQSQRVVDLSAAIRVLVPKNFHRDQILLDLTWIFSHFCHTKSALRFRRAAVHEANQKHLHAHKPCGRSRICTTHLPASHNLPETVANKIVF